MSCLVSCALLPVLALWVSTTPANCPAKAIAAAHVHVFLFRRIFFFSPSRDLRLGS
jgi:hypothetical protein